MILHPIFLSKVCVDYAAHGSRGPREGPKRHDSGVANSMKPPALAFNAARPESGGAEKHAGARADAAARAPPASRQPPEADPPPEAALVT